MVLSIGISSLLFISNGFDMSTMYPSMSKLWWRIRALDVVWRINGLQLRWWRTMRTWRWKPRPCYPKRKAMFLTGCRQFLTIQIHAKVLWPFYLVVRSTLWDVRYIDSQSLQTRGKFKGLAELTADDSGRYLKLTIWADLIRSVG